MSPHAAARVTVAVFLLGALACAPAPAPPPPPGSVYFAALGDAPYSRVEEVRFERLIDRLNDQELAVVLQVGDIFWYPCSEAMYRGRLAMLGRIRHPVVYTPGDNDWTDCWQRIAGRYRPLDRLAELRRIFFVESSVAPGGGRLAVESQAERAGDEEYVENLRWRIRDVLFLTLHLVGSANGAEPFPGRSGEDDAEVARRTRAAIAWLEDGFAAAAAERPPAVVVAMHADPAFELPRPHPYRRRFEPLLEALAAAAAEWGGPVLLIHGDSHEFVVDRPLADRRGRRLDNLTRLQVPGSPEIGWVEVTVTPGEPEPFGFSRRRVRRRVLDRFRWPG